MLDAVVISDLHLGSGVCQAEKLEGFLEALPSTRRLILNGDVLDSSHGRLKKHHWKVLGILRKLSDTVQLIWVKGNHDWNADYVADLIGACFLEQYRFESGGRKIICIHGDRFDDFIAKRPGVTWLADWAYYFLQQINLRLARLAKRNSKIFVRSCEKVKRKALSYLGLTIGSILCGHTHHPEEGDRYSNSGCWTEDQCTYLEIRDGTVSLKEFGGS